MHKCDNHTCNVSEQLAFFLYNRTSHLHGDTHGVAKVDNDEGDDGEQLLLGVVAPGHISGRTDWLFEKL